MACALWRMIFLYGLGTEISMHIGDCAVIYDPNRRLIRLDQGDSFTRITRLV